MPEWFFWLFATAMIVSALGVLFSSQSMVSLLWMFSVVLCVSGLLAFMQAYLLALILLLVYVGAILVLFTFVLMFIGQRLPKKKLGRVRLMMGGIGLAFMIVFILPLLLQGSSPSCLLTETPLGHSGDYGKLLFGRYHLLVQLCGWLLLWVSVGTLRLLKNPVEKDLIQS